jgi:hypothetical protein
VDGDVIIRPDGATEWKYVFQRVPARMGRRNEMQSRSALPLQPSNVSGLEVLANGVLGVSIHIEINWQKIKLSKTPSHIPTYFQWLDVYSGNRVSVNQRGRAVGPPNVVEAPNPTSSVKMSRTLGAPLGASRCPQIHRLHSGCGAGLIREATRGNTNFLCESGTFRNRSRRNLRAGA